MNLILWVLIFAIHAAKKLTDRFQTLSTAKQLRQWSFLTKDSQLDIDGPLLSKLLVPRVSGTESNKKVQDFIISAFEKLGWHVEQDKFTDDTPNGKVEFNNIIVTKDIHAPRKLVLAAHFDSKLFYDFDFIGATDSAVPCAILMDIALSLDGALTRKMETLERYSTVQIIFFDGEEAVVEWTPTDSIYGARHLAKKWEDRMIVLESGKTVNPISQIDAFVLLDLLGTKDAVIQNSKSATQWVWDRLVRIQEKLAMLKLLSPHLQKRFESGNYLFTPGQPTLGEYAIQDDHVPFQILGVPIVHCIAAPFPNEWHTEKDNADALDQGMIYDLALIYRVLVAEYLGLIDFLD
ncbi:hypothetical protein HDV01_003494 [Terramyces sp. JEL0728]|nr:hypothetical protein HDV01_003494 [Terramyces sp. JEL0728]